jgi:hypothetical protein
MTDSAKHPRLTLVDGAQGGMTASDWANAGCSCWSVLTSRLQQAGVSPSQVTTAWIKLADAGPTSGFPGYARTLKDETAAVLRLLKERFANLALAYLSSRIYAGYATTTLNPEPYAYESGLAVRWVIEDQIDGAPSMAFSGVGAGTVRACLGRAPTCRPTARTRAPAGDRRWPSVSWTL